MENLYLFLSSNDSKTYFQNNKPENFSVYLGERLNFPSNEKWEVGLIEIEYSYSNLVNGNCIEVYSSICDYSYIHDNKAPILRKIITVYPKDNIKVTSHKVYPKIIYIPIKEREFDIISIYIKDGAGQPASFLQGAVSCTLHLKKSK